jgi:hypothetical protein
MASSFAHWNGHTVGTTKNCCQLKPATHKAMSNEGEGEGVKEKGIPEAIAPR